MSIHRPLEPTPQQILAVRIIWAGQTIISTLVIAVVMLVVIPGLDMKLPTLQLAPREVLVGGVSALAVLSLWLGRYLRNTWFAPNVPQAAPDPLQRALTRLNANSALVGGLLASPFMIGVALYLVTQDPLLIYAGAWAPLFGGLWLWPDPARAVKEIAAL